MAFFRLEMDNVKADRNVEGKFLYDFREGKYKNGKKSEELIHKEALNIPKFAENNPRFFWKCADEFEGANRRKARQMTLTLPNELNDEENIKITQEFINEIIGNDFPCSYSLHKSFNEDGVGNIHAHILFSTRKQDGINRNYQDFFKRYNANKKELGGTQKDDTWNKKEKLIIIRKQFENIINKSLEKNNISERVNSNSLKDQRKEAIKKGDFILAEKLDRVPINIEGYLLYSNDNTKTLVELEKLELFKISKEIKKLKDEVYFIKMKNFTEENIIAKKELFNSLIGNEDKYNVIREIRKEHMEEIDRILPFNLEKTIIKNKEILKTIYNKIEEDKEEKTNIQIIEKGIKEKLKEAMDPKEILSLKKSLRDNNNSYRLLELNIIKKLETMEIIKNENIKNQESIPKKVELLDLLVDKLIVVDKTVNQIKFAKTSLEYNNLRSRATNIVTKGELPRLEKELEKITKKSFIADVENIRVAEIKKEIESYSTDEILGKIIARENILKKAYEKNLFMLEKRWGKIEQIDIGTIENNIFKLKLTNEEKKGYLDNLFDDLKIEKDKKDELKPVIEVLRKKVKDQMIFFDLENKLEKNKETLKTLFNTIAKEKEEKTNIQSLEKEIKEKLKVATDPKKINKLVEELEGNNNSYKMAELNIVNNLEKIEKLKENNIKTKELIDNNSINTTKQMRLVELEKLKELLTESNDSLKIVENKIIKSSEKIKIIKKLKVLKVDFLQSKFKNSNNSVNLKKLHTGKQIKSMGYKGEEEDNER